MKFHIVLTWCLVLNAGKNPSAIYTSPRRHALERLYEKLLFNYENAVRPVSNPLDILNVTFGAFLLQILDINERTQILTTSLWLDLAWTDSKLTWEPQEFDNVTSIHIPSELVWTPDLVLENNAAGLPQITIASDVIVNNNGEIQWTPPALYKSFCAIDIRFFPYDEQNCQLKFMVWTHDGDYVKLDFFADVDTELGIDEDGDVMGMDLANYVRSSAWKLLNNTAVRHKKVYEGCCGSEKYYDVTFYLHLRRMPLFFTFSFICPCVLITVITVFVFLLPAGSEEKMTLSISVLVSIAMLFLMVIEMIPPSSLSVPLLSRYLIFDLTFSTLSIAVSIMAVRLDYNGEYLGRMGKLTRYIFLDKLAKLLCMNHDDDSEELSQSDDLSNSEESLNKFNMVITASNDFHQAQNNGSTLMGQGKIFPGLKKQLTYKQALVKVANSVRFMAERLREQDDLEKIEDEWCCLAMVIDRLFLWIFLISSVVATVAIIFKAPSLYDLRIALDA